MSKLIVMNEKATYCATKIYVNGERLSRSKDKNRKIDTEYKMIQEVELDPGIKEIYLKYTFVSTKPVKIELKEDKTYILKWKQKFVLPILIVLVYIFIMGLIIFSFVDDYTLDVRLVVLPIGFFMGQVFWNDVLLLARKIEIVEQVEDIKVKKGVKFIKY